MADFSPNQETETEGTEALRHFLARIPFAALQTDRSGNVVFANQALVDLLRYTTPEALCGIPLDAFVVQPTAVREILDRLAVEQAVSGVLLALRMRTGEPVEVEAVVVSHPQGWMDWLFVPPQSEARIRRNVIRYIVHQLTQPLTIVLGYSDLLVQQLPSDTPQHNLAVKIEESARKIADIIQALRESAANGEK